MIKRKCRTCGKDCYGRQCRKCYGKKKFKGQLSKLK
jgi:hypothetical protein